MLERLIKLFKDLETYGLKPTDKNIVRKVADAYELLGLPDERKRVFGKYKSLFSEAGCSKGCRNLYKKNKKYGQEKIFLRVQMSAQCCIGT